MGSHHDVYLCVGPSQSLVLQDTFTGSATGGARPGVTPSWGCHLNSGSTDVFQENFGKIFEAACKFLLHIHISLRGSQAQRLTWRSNSCLSGSDSNGDDLALILVEAFQPLRDPCLAVPGRDAWLSTEGSQPTKHTINSAQPLIIALAK